MNEHSKDSVDYNRRDFLKTGSLASIMAMMGGVELVAQAAEPAGGEVTPGAAKLKLGVIGLGPWGREILSTLALLPTAEISGICDNYPAFLKRSAKTVPDAVATDDYDTLLQNKDIKAVVVATPTHLHKEIVLAALKAGKHVYCEAPLAHTIDDARAIAQAAKAAKHLVFQTGLQKRSDPQRHFLLPFIRSGALGKFAMARAQWHKKTSWRSTSPNPEREKEINWRLEKDLSLGLVGEFGIHPIDQAMWYINSRPSAVTGFSSTILWNDGRTEPDTVQAILEFGGGVNMIYHATLANSFDADYEMLYGSDAAVMMRESNAWMFKEVDSPLLGWEVYARKESFYKETGIILKADASKTPPGKEAPEPVPFKDTPLSYSLGNFIRNANSVSAAAEDFISIMGEDDKEGLTEHLSQVPRQPAAGFEDGYVATVIAVKAHEAALQKKRVEIPTTLYELP